MHPESMSSAKAEREALRSGEIRVRGPTLLRLFDPMDPSPVTRRDLLPSVAEFIVSWGREIPLRAPLTLVIHLDEPASDDDTRAATTGFHVFFEERAAAKHRALRHMFRLGRISLLIALVVLGLALFGGEALRGTGSSLGTAVGSTLEIGGWVAMWRPLEVFLYDWWPIRADIRLFRRLAGMDVRIVHDSPS